MTSPKVSIVILNYKNWKDTVECLQTVLDITYSPCRIIVVDSDSQNDSLVHIGAWLKQQGREFLLQTQEQSGNQEVVDCPLVLIQSASNRGYAAGNNIGIRWAVRAKDDYILILNNDTLVEKGFLEPLADFLDTHPDTVMVGPKILDLNGNIAGICTRRRYQAGDYFFRDSIFGRIFPNNYWCRRHFYIGEYDFSVPRPVDVISGSCMLICSQFLRETGLLDENTSLFMEEFILCEKIRKCPEKNTYIVPQSVIIHKQGQSTKKQVNSKMLKVFEDSMSYDLKERGTDDAGEVNSMIETIVSNQNEYTRRVNNASHTAYKLAENCFSEFMDFIKVFDAKKCN